MLLDIPGGTAAIVQHVEKRDQRRIEFRQPMRLRESRVVVRIDRIAAQRRELFFRRRHADLHGLWRAVEIRAAQVAQLRCDQYVVGPECGQLRVGLLFHHHREHLAGDRERGIELVGGGQALTHVDDDHALRAHRSRHVDRHVVADAAIHEHVALVAQRRERGRHRHAGANRHGQVARAEHHPLAVADVGGDGAERNRQVVEILRDADGQQQAAQQQLQFLALHGAARKRDLAVAQAEFDAAEETQLVLLAPHRQFGARRIVAEHVLPVDVVEHVADLRGVVAGRVQATHNGAHRRADDAIHGDVLAFEYLEHADVCRSACAAAAKHEAGFRPLRRLRNRANRQHDQAQAMAQHDGNLRQYCAA